MYVKNSTLHYPFRVAVDARNNLVYIVESVDGVVRVNRSTNIIRRFAGRYDRTGPDSDNGLATSAKLSNPSKLDILYH
jgi:hypothetical protein